MTRTDGLRVEGWVVRTGVPLPPPCGPARTDFCIVEGIKSLQTSFRRYGQALALTGVHLPRRLADLPPRYPLHELHAEARSQRVGRDRVRRWFKLRNKLDDLNDAGRVLGVHHLGDDWGHAEEAARSALESAVAAFNWIDDVAQDLDEQRLIDIDSFSPNTGVYGWGKVSMGALLDRVHELAHLTGELVGGLFGCRLVHSGEEWTKRCPLSLMHIRLGYSPNTRELRFLQVRRRS